MRKLNPEIEKFWVDAGYEVYDVRPSAILNNSMWVILWGGRKEDGFSTVSIAVSETIGGPTGRCEETCKILYCWNHKTYFEDEMLRIIKQKAFL